MCNFNNSIGLSGGSHSPRTGRIDLITPINSVQISIFYDKNHCCLLVEISRSPMKIFYLSPFQLKLTWLVWIQFDSIRWCSLVNDRPSILPPNGIWLGLDWAQTHWQLYTLLRLYSFWLQITSRNVFL